MLGRHVFIAVIIFVISATFADASSVYQTAIVDRITIAKENIILKIDSIAKEIISEIRSLAEIGSQNIDSVVAKSDFVVEEISNSFVLFPQNVKEVFQETTLAIKQKQKDISDSIYDKPVFALGRFTTTIQLARSHLLEGGTTSI